MQHTDSINQAVSQVETGSTQTGGMTEDELRQSALTLVNGCGVAVVASLDASGHPFMKAMLKMETEGLKTVWFSTNTSSKRVGQFRKDNRASVYFMDQASFQGLLLIGEMEVLQDDASRQRLWRDGFEIYYPKGVNDPDYSVLRFTAREVNYYHGLSNGSFKP